MFGNTEHLVSNPEGAVVFVEHCRWVCGMTELGTAGAAGGASASIEKLAELARKFGTAAEADKPQLAARASSTGSRKGTNSPDVAASATMARSLLILMEGFQIGEGE